MTTQLRQVTYDHAYYTRHTNCDAFARHSLLDPATQLLQLARDQQSQALTRQLATMPADIIRRISWTHMDDMERILLAGQAQWTSTPSLPPAATLMRCPQCGFQTHSPIDLKRHLTAQHNHHRFHAHEINFHVHACDGLPQCKRCLRTFRTWRQFKRHIAATRCQVPTMETMTGLRRGILATGRTLPLQRAFPEDWTATIVAHDRMTGMPLPEIMTC